MKYVYIHDVNRFVQFAVRVWNVELVYASYENIALEGIKRTREFFQKIGLPVTLKEGNIDESKIEEMADKCTENGTQTVGQFVRLNKEDVINMLNLAK